MGKGASNFSQQQLPQQNLRQRPQQMGGKGSGVGQLPQAGAFQPPQQMGGKGGMASPMDPTSVSPAQPGIAPRPDIFVRPQLPGGLPPQIPGGIASQPPQPGMPPRPDIFVRPINPATIYGPSIAPQPLDSKGGMAGAMPPGLQPGGMPPDMQPAITRPGMPPGYDQPFFDRQMQLKDRIQRFTDRRFGDMTPENMAQIQQAVQNRFGKQIDRLNQQMQPQRAYPAPAQSQPTLASGLSALAQNPALRNLIR